MLLCYIASEAAHFSDESFDIPFDERMVARAHLATLPGGHGLLSCERRQDVNELEEPDEVR